ncbi:MAG TPA: family 78 glycoside hydrolase catalytic domain, partial [Opitutaceae bacterium]|nr:family 78 glycoside hydrolase catalytic domain [Opitutaceae bacterium]
FRTGTMVADYTDKEYPHRSRRGVELPVAGIAGRYVRVTATRLRVEEGRACFALSQLEVLSGGRNVAVGARVTASDSEERGPWAARALTDELGALGANPRANATLLFRRGFAVRPGLRRALVFVCGLGQYRMTINGRSAGGPAIAPGWTDFAKTCLYDTLDVTALVHAGPNAAGLMLAGGMYNVQEGRFVKFITPFRPLTAIAQIRLEYADGTVETVGTDDQWRVSAGPVTFANMYGGEDYDARLEPHGWDQAGFDESRWGAAAVWAGPGGALRGHSRGAPPVSEFETLQPVTTHQLGPGVTVYDLGQNASVMLRLKVRGPAGATVRVIPAELLARDGSVDRASCGPRGPAWWQYTLAGGGEETWAARFFYHGCRYLQVECAAAPGASVPEGSSPASNHVPGWDLPVVESLEGVVVQAAAPPAGEFACSNQLFNRIHALVRWAQRSNLMSVMTDCPHRERLGWLEQNHLNGPALRYEFGLARLMAKTANDMADGQQADGLVPNIAPEYVIFSDGFRDSPEWGSACVLIPWQQYEWTGDVDLLRQSYGMMKRYVGRLAAKADHHMVDFGLGDWYDLGPEPPGKAQLTPIALTATAFFFEDARILARAAALLGKPDEAKSYQDMADAIRAAFNQRFFDPAKDCYAAGSQCANAIPLVMGLAEPARRAEILAAIVRDVRDRGNALTAGDVGYRYLLRALADGGRSGVVFDLTNQSDKPGYGYQLAQGATSLTEAWDADRRSSQNHFMLGQINEWFYHDLAGIQPDPEGPGFKRIIIRPAIVGDLTWVRAAYDSIRGRVVSEWKRTGRRLALNVTIPPNTTATVFVPAVDPVTVRVGGRAPGRHRGVTFLRQGADAAVYAIESGSYAFSSVLLESR